MLSSPFIASCSPPQELSAQQEYFHWLTESGKSCSDIQLIFLLTVALSAMIPDYPDCSLEHDWPSKMQDSDMACSWYSDVMAFTVQVVTIQEASS